MIVTKISEDSFTLHKQNEEYTLYMGEITPQTPRPFTIQISEVEDSSKVDLEMTCGCTTFGREIVNKTTVNFTISYGNCDVIFKKTVVIVNKNKNTILKIQGTCQ